ncbi:MAG: glycine cleavage system protein GcvH [Candidatus Eisenbacteria bacterium]|nr:glycine cleavage system protein GcvH [Candidatus Eisenbacteria bacterium]
MTLIPENLKYTDEHEWLRIEGDTAVVGITDYAQHELGDIVYVELPPVGKKAEVKKAFGVVEAVKTVSDIFAPVSGEIVAVNEALAADASVVNREPYGQGWMIEIKMSNPADTGALLGPAEYRKLLGE